MSAKENGKPILVKRGSVQVRIYQVRRKAGPQKGCDFYQVADYSSGTRQLRSFGDRGQAIAEAERIASLMARGEAYAANFENKDRASFARAVEILSPLGIPLEVAVADYVELVQMVGGQRQRLPEAVRSHLARAPLSLPNKSVSEAVTELLERKKSVGVSDRYLQDLESRLNRFQASFSMPLSHITRGILLTAKALREAGKNKMEAQRAATQLRKLSICLNS